MWDSPGVGGSREHLKSTFSRKKGAIDVLESQHLRTLYLLLLVSTNIRKFIFQTMWCGRNVRLNISKVRYTPESRNAKKRFAIVENKRLGYSWRWPRRKGERTLPSTSEMGRKWSRNASQSQSNCRRWLNVRESGSQKRALEEK